MSGGCCVEGCIPTPKENILYFQFPVKPALVKRWRTSLGIKSKLPPTPQVCSRHFSQGDYEMVRGKMRLRARVVPTLCPQSKSPEPEDETAKTNGETTTEITKEVDNKQVTNDEACQEQHKTKASSKKRSSNKRKTRSARKKQLMNKESSSEEESEESSREEGIRDSLEHLNNVDDNVEDKCTIECAPDLPHDDDSASEMDLPKEKDDIEDIIANYHIKQDKELAERLKEAQLKENLLKEKLVQEQEEEKTKERKKPEQVKQTHTSKRKERQRAKTISDDDDVMEVEYVGNKTTFIEVAVDSVGGSDRPESPKDDCLMLLENVQVDIDPSSLILQYDKDDDSDDGDKKKKEAISLLTSSDDDDVILEEPKIDIVEVSDEDEDDVPLVKLLETGKPSNLGKILWGSVHEYYCMQCGFKTTNRGDYNRHKKQSHSTVILMCDVCNYTTPSKTQFERHRKRHKDDKKFKCHLCDYKAKHSMSLIYHLKSHEDVNFKHIKKILTCSKCNKFSATRGSDLVRHVRACKRNVPFHVCDECSYKTKRKSDLRRHINRIHSSKIGNENDDD